jgi:RNA polymerase sigma factor (sigma-70 family)
MGVLPITAPPQFLPELHTTTLNDIVISHELLSRPIRKVNARAEIAAIHGLANLLPQGLPMVLDRLARLAVELCDAGSAGISMLETGDDGAPVFRWRALAGELEKHKGGTVPGDWSPCGECLNAGKATLYSYPARFFTYLQSIDTLLVEALIIPMYAEGKPLGTIWIVTHDTQRRFDAEDVRVMTSLAGFVAAALRVWMRTGIDLAASPGVEREVAWGEFVRRTASGDPLGLQALIDETKPIVFARALRILSSPADAEEIAADVYAQVWKSAGRYNPERYNVSAWLLNIARSRAIDRLRSRASRDHQRSGEVLYRMCSGTADPETYAAHGETQQIVRQALQAISLEQREAIELAYFDGYTMTEIAARLSLPLGTVKTQVRTGLVALRRLIATTESHVPANAAKPNGRAAPTLRANSGASV